MIVLLTMWYNLKNNSVNNYVLMYFLKLCKNMLNKRGWRVKTGWGKRMYTTRSERKSKCSLDGWA